MAAGAVSWEWVPFITGVRVLMIQDSRFGIQNSRFKIWVVSEKLKTTFFGVSSGFWF